jgi:cAMP phosphodiesterase
MIEIIGRKGTSSVLLNKYNVIDAGNIFKKLANESYKLENIWLTHAHLDHIVDIPFLLDKDVEKREKSLNIIALEETIETLKDCMFNDKIWPDFSKIDLLNGQGKMLTYTTIEIDKLYSFGNNETMEPFTTYHTNGSCGFIYTKNQKSILVTSDINQMEGVIHLLNQRKNINHIVIECSFPSNMKELANLSQHLTPSLLFKALKELKRDDITVYISHTKASYEKKINDEISQYRGDLTIKTVNCKEISLFF